MRLLSLLQHGLDGVADRFDAHEVHLPRKLVDLLVGHDAGMKTEPVRFVDALTGVETARSSPVRPTSPKLMTPSGSGFVAKARRNGQQHGQVDRRLVQLSCRRRH